jgi:hypothetical protein
MSLAADDELSLEEDFNATAGATQCVFTGFTSKLLADRETLPQRWP